jgi:hypothetical protein
VIPIVFTTAPAVPGGGWGSASALALFGEYSDSVVSTCKRRHVPCIDLRSACITAMNTGKVANINALLLDDVHYRWTSPAVGPGNILHNETGALNIAMHHLTHMIGFLYDTHAWAYPQGVDPRVARSALGYPTDSMRYSPTTAVEVPDDERPAVHASPDISVRPNPINGPVSIVVDLARTNASAMSVSVYDVNGKLVRQLYSGSNTAGGYMVFPWDCRNSTGMAVHAGVYFTRLQVNGKTFTQRMLVMK